IPEARLEGDLAGGARHRDARDQAVAEERESRVREALFDGTRDTLAAAAAFAANDRADVAAQLLESGECRVLVAGDAFLGNRVLLDRHAHQADDHVGPVSGL